MSFILQWSTFWNISPYEQIISEGRIHLLHMTAKGQTLFNTDLNDCFVFFMETSQDHLRYLQAQSK